MQPIYYVRKPGTARSIGAFVLCALAVSAVGCGTNAGGSAQAASRFSIAVLIKTSPDDESQKHGERVTGEFVEALRSQDWEDVVKLRAPAGAASVGQTLKLAEGARAGYAMLGSVAPGPNGTQLRVELYAPPSSRLLWEDQITVDAGNAEELAWRAHKFVRP